MHQILTAYDAADWSSKSISKQTIEEPAQENKYCPAALVGHQPDRVRLANALAALYPKNSVENRLLDAMLLAVPG